MAARLQMKIITGYPLMLAVISYTDHITKIKQIIVIVGKHIFCAVRLVIPSFFSSVCFPAYSSNSSLVMVFISLKASRSSRISARIIKEHSKWEILLSIYAMFPNIQTFSTRPFNLSSVYLHSFSVYIFRGRKVYSCYVPSHRYYTILSDTLNDWSHIF